MFNWLRLLVDRQVRDASVRARALVERDGELQVVGVSVRADEADRWIFAVFFRALQRPMPYRLVAVAKESVAAEYVSEADAYKYRIRGRK